MSSRAGSVGVIGVLLLALAGCAGDAPEGEPTPSVSGFASEEEAFEVGETTYRDYVAAINARNAGEPGADPLQYLQGDLRETEKEIYRQSDEGGLRWEGELKITRLWRDRASLLGGTASVHLNACMDASEWKIVNADGEDVTLDDVPLHNFTTVDMVAAEPGQLAITGLVPDFESTEC